MEGCTIASVMQRHDWDNPGPLLADKSDLDFPPSVNTHHHRRHTISPPLHHTPPHTPSVIVIHARTHGARSPQAIGQDQARTRPFNRKHVPSTSSTHEPASRGAIVLCGGHQSPSHHPTLHETHNGPPPVMCRSLTSHHSHARAADHGNCDC
jgi:hypothetical protein